jgi:hypothetical protein
VPVRLIYEDKKVVPVTTDEGGDAPDPAEVNMDDVLTMSDGSPLKRFLRLVDDCCLKVKTAPLEIDLILSDDEALREMAAYAGQQRKLMESGLKKLGQVQITRARRMTDMLDRRRTAAKMGSYTNGARVSVGLTISPEERLISDRDFNQLRVPGGYDVVDNGVFATSGRGGMSLVVPAPLLIVRRLSDYDTGVARRVIAWPGVSQWESATVERGDMLNAQKLVSALSRYEDAPLSSGNVLAVVNWLLAFDQANKQHLPDRKATDHLGWHVGRGRGAESKPRLFVLPGQTLPAPGVPKEEDLEVDPPNGMGVMCRNLTSRGTLEEWTEWINQDAAEHPTTMSLLLASLASPLVRLLRGPTPFVMDASGPHGTGKTTSQRVGMTPWGAGGEGDAGFMGTWNVASTVAVERMAVFLNAIPLFMDDTQKAAKKAILGDVLMTHSSGTGRGRGHREGGIQEHGSWSNILISTGESAITDFTKMAGAVDRVICLRGSPFGGSGADGGAVARRLSLGTTTYYGTAGPALIAWLSMLDDAGMEKLQALYDRHVERLTTRRGSESSTQQRLSVHVALLMTTLEVVERLGFFRSRCNIEEYLLNSIAQSDPVSDRPSQAMVDLEGLIVSNKTGFYGRHEDGLRGRGFYGQWANDDGYYEVCIMPHTLRGWMESLGYTDWQGVVDTWHQRGWLCEQDEGSRVRRGSVGEVTHVRVQAPKVRRSVDGENASLYGIRRQAFAEAQRLLSVTSNTEASPALIR